MEQLVPLVVLECYTLLRIGRYFSCLLPLLNTFIVSRVVKLGASESHFFEHPGLLGIHLELDFQRAEHRDNLVPP